MKQLFYNNSALGYVKGLRNNLRVTIVDGTKLQRLWRHPCIHTARTSVRNGVAASEAVLASRNLEDVATDQKHVACGAHDRAVMVSAPVLLLRLALVTVRLVIAACEAVE
jgi:hypothetical protein